MTIKKKFFIYLIPTRIRSFLLLNKATVIQNFERVIEGNVVILIWSYDISKGYETYNHIRNQNFKDVVHETFIFLTLIAQQKTVSWPRSIFVT